MVESTAEPHTQLQDHNRMIVDQFSKQAIPFSQMPGHSSAAAMNLLIRLTSVNPQDNVLDVACGPGLVACAFAEVAGHVTGIDLTPAMIERARGLQKQQRRINLSWRVGDVSRLPFADEKFSLVLSRYAFHHFVNPEQVLAEMCRVCAPGGRVAVVDAFVPADPARAAAYNRMEKLRDPSHVRAMSLMELQNLLRDAGLRELKAEFYRVPMELEQQLQASFPNPGDADLIRQMLREDLGRDDLGVGAHLENDEIHFSYPIVALVGRRY